MLKLTRELRFGLHDTEPALLSNSANGFAANPMLIGIAPFLTLKASLSGDIDPATGMLINIKIVDRVLRDFAIPILRQAYYTERKPVSTILTQLFDLLRAKFSPHSLESLKLNLSPYLEMSITAKEPHMLSLTERFEFSAAHRLHSETLSENENVEIFGRCNNANGHGHNYEIEVTVSGTPTAGTGEILPISMLQQIVNVHVLDQFDHKHLNLDCAEFKTLNPTVENIAKVIYEKLKGKIPAPAKLARIRVWETPKTVAEYSEA